MTCSSELTWTPTPTVAHRDELDPEKLDQLLLGWDKDHWELACPARLTYRECVTVMTQGMEPYSRFMVVSPSEFSHLGIPTDFAASEYFSLIRQREISIRNHSGKRATTPAEYHAVTERILDPRGE
jgi:hypothetical protein